jgi:hypothetical protein
MEMHHVMIRDAIGSKRALANPKKARKWAKRELATNDPAAITTLCEGGGHDGWWCLPEDLEYFANVLSEEGLKILAKLPSTAHIK